MKEFYRRHLPHWQPHGAIFFVTFRLKNSLSKDVIKRLQEERVTHNRHDDQRYFEKWEYYLDQAEFGPRWLSQPEIAGIVKEAMHHRDSDVFDLHAYCIMSNHVHVVFSRLEWQSDLPLSTIMQSLKRHTARQANIVLCGEGAFWQDESYDRVIRDNTEYIRVIHYVLENPVKAGFVSQWNQWSWSYCKLEVAK